MSVLPPNSTIIQEPKRFAIQPIIGLQSTFVLGCPINDVIVKIKNALFHKIEFKYSDQNPLDLPLILNLSDGISLRFDSKSQRLYSIEIYLFNSFLYSYNGTDLNPRSNAPSFLAIYKLFGPIYPGKYATKHKETTYTLNYPGISFVFAIPKGYPCSLDIPVQFGDGTSPILQRLYIHNSKDTLAQASSIPLLMAGEPMLCDYNAQYPEVVKISANGVSFPDRGITLSLGSSSGDLIALLDRPDQIHDKNQDLMKIHQGVSSPTNNCNHGRDYFFNYFGIGMDFLLDSCSHLVKKIVLHLNFPGHHAFGRYRRCFYSIDGTSISFASKFETVQEEFGTSSGAPVIYNRAASDFSSRNRNPFDATSFYSVNGMIFEVLKNKHISSITLFEQ